jgi:hypothetical protein
LATATRVAGPAPALRRTVGSAPPEGRLVVLSADAVAIPATPVEKPLVPGASSPVRPTVGPAQWAAGRAAPRVVGPGCPVAPLLALEEGTGLLVPFTMESSTISLCSTESKEGTIGAEEPFVLRTVG